MSIRYRFESGILVLHLDGEYSKEDLARLVLTALADPSCPVRPVLLFDFSFSKGIHHRSTKEVLEMAGFLIGLKDRLGTRVAFCAPEDLSFGFMRMGTVGIEDIGIRTEVFRTIDEAWVWLRS
jgi:hypothetical protein